MFINKSVLKCYIETKPLCINEHDEFNKIKMKNSNYSMRWFFFKKEWYLIKMLYTSFMALEKVERQI